jgi:hypothetical protein
MIDAERNCASGPGGLVLFGKCLVGSNLPGGTTGVKFRNSAWTPPAGLRQTQEV